MLPGATPWPDDLAARYRTAGLWEGRTLGELLSRAATAHGERDAVVGGGRRWSYAELDRRAARCAAGLRRLGLRPRDRVVVQLPNVPDFLEVLFGLLRAGAIPVLALPSHRAADIGHLLRHTEARAYVVPGVHGGFDYRALARRAAAGVRHVIVAGDAEEFTPLADVTDLGEDAGGGAGEGAERPDPSDVALMQLSGGTTGTPKLIPRTHDDYACCFRAGAEVCGLTPGDAYLCALPIAHNFALAGPGVLGALSAGATTVLAPSPAAGTCFPLVAAERVTITALVPPFALAWLEAAARATAGTGPPPELASLRILQVGGARLAAAAAARIRPVLGCDLQQVFGMAEGLVCYTRPDDPEPVRLGTQGRPLSPHDEIRVVDDEGRAVAPGETGHLLTRGPYTVRGYYKAAAHNAETFTADGFYRTGDLVRVTPDGNLVVEGRAKDQINRGGEKVAPAEIERHLLAHPAVRDAAVVAAPDRLLGELVCALLVPREPARRLDAPEVKAWLRDRGVATYKIPDLVVTVDRLPRTGVGKVSVRELRAALPGLVPAPSSAPSPAPSQEPHRQEPPR